MRSRSSVYEIVPYPDFDNVRAEAKAIAVHVPGPPTPHGFVHILQRAVALVRRRSAWERRRQCK